MSGGDCAALVVADVDQRLVRAKRDEVGIEPSLDGTVDLGLPSLQGGDQANLDDGAGSGRGRNVTEDRIFAIRSNVHATRVIARSETSRVHCFSDRLGYAQRNVERLDRAVIVPYHHGLAIGSDAHASRLPDAENALAQAMCGNRFHILQLATRLFLVGRDAAGAVAARGATEACVNPLFG